jgi:hypothetical protein
MSGSLSIPWFIHLLLIFIHASYSRPMEEASGNPPEITASITAGVYLQRMPMHFSDSSIPLIYEMPVPDLQTMQKYSIIPPNPKMPFIGTINEIISHTHDLLSHLSPSSHPTPSRKPSSDRRKRSVIDISDFYSWCCGIGKQRDVDGLFVHEKSIDSFLTKMKAQVNRDHSFLIQRNKLDNEFEANVARTLNNSMTEIETASNALARAELGIESEIKTESNGLLQIATTMYAIISTSTWTQVLSDCRNKIIPIAIVQPHILMEDLLKLNHSLSMRYKTLGIHPDLISTYYTQPLAACHVSASKIIVTVKVPTRQANTRYTLLKITPVPFIFHQTVCQINMQSSYVIQMNDSVILLEPSQILQCNPSLSSVCKVSRFPKFSSPSSSCIHEIFSSSPTTERLNALCPLICTHESTPTTIIQQINEHEFIIVNPALPVFLKCHNEMEHLLKYNSSVGHLSLLLPCRCMAMVHSLDGITTTLTPDFPCANSGPSVASYSHTIPSAFIIVDSPMLNEENVYPDVRKLLNHEWPKSIPYTNLSAPEIQELPSISSLTKIGAHLSLAHSFIIVIVIGLIMVLFYRTCGLVLPIFPGASAMEDMEIIRISMDSIIITLLFCIVFIFILTFCLLRRAAILNMQQDRIILSSVKIKAHARKRKPSQLDSAAPDELITRL